MKGNVVNETFPCMQSISFKRIFTFFISCDRRSPREMEEKRTPDSELYKVDQEDEQEVVGEENSKTLQLPSRYNMSDQDSTENPLRTSRSQVEIPIRIEPNYDARPRALPSYSEHEMENSILEHDPSPTESEETGGGATALLLPAISENSYDSDDDDLFSPGIYTQNGQETEETTESGADEEELDADENLMDTEFTRDYYRIGKHESNEDEALHDGISKFKVQLVADFANQAADHVEAYKAPVLAMLEAQFAKAKAVAQDAAHQVAEGARKQSPASQPITTPSSRDSGERTTVNDIKKSNFNAAMVAAITALFKISTRANTR